VHELRVEDQRRGHGRRTRVDRTTAQAKVERVLGAERAEPPADQHRPPQADDHARPAEDADHDHNRSEPLGGGGRVRDEPAEEDERRKRSPYAPTTRARRRNVVTSSSPSAKERSSSQRASGTPASWNRARSASRRSSQMRRASVAISPFGGCMNGSGESSTTT